MWEDQDHCEWHHSLGNVLWTVKACKNKSKHSQLSIMALFLFALACGDDVARSWPTAMDCKLEM